MPPVSISRLMMMFLLIDYNSMDFMYCLMATGFSCDDGRVLRYFSVPVRAEGSVWGYSPKAVRFDTTGWTL